MAVITPTIAEVRGFMENAHVITWATMLNGDSGSPMEMPASEIRSIQFDGTFGTGGTILLEGSNDGTNYFTLTDPQGNAISKTSAGLEAAQERPRFIRPRVSAGDGTTSLNARLLLKRGY